MKLVEIEKLNKELSLQSENFTFFTDLYRHCINVLETVPDKFIKDLFMDTYQNAYAVVESILIGRDASSGNTAVRFEIFDREADDYDVITYVAENTNFDFRDVSIKINFDDAAIDSIVQFYIGDSFFTVRDAKRIFGKYLIKVQDDFDYISVSTKCFS